MKTSPTDFDEFFIATVLADLFDSTGSEDLDFVAKKITDGLLENGLIKNIQIDNDDELIAC